MCLHTHLSSEFFYQAIAGELEVKESGIQILAPQCYYLCGFKTCLLICLCILSCNKDTALTWPDYCEDESEMNVKV